MPAPGDQHRQNTASMNPFLEPQRHVNEYTAKEIATLQSRLDKQLGPEYISTRPGAGGGKVHYLAAEKVINLANEVFGFNGWSSEIRRYDIDFVDEHPESRKITLGLSTIVRVTLRDGTFHEDIGYGHIENCKGKAAAFEKARKEAATDALKRALRSFGKVLGNCLYDKDYLTRVSKVKIQPSKWDENRLHRHPDYSNVPVKQEQQRDRTSEPVSTSAAIINGNQAVASQGTDFEDDFGGGNLFDELGPDEVLLPNDEDNQSSINNPHEQPRRPQRVQQIHPSEPSPRQTTKASSTNLVSRNHLSRNQPIAESAGPPPPQEQPVPADIPAGFVTSRAAIPSNGTKDEPLSVVALASLPRFNPNTESPSIRKTSGFNHSTSTPIKRTSLPGASVTAAPVQSTPAGISGAPNQAPLPNQGTSVAQRNFVNPGLDPGRRVGMPNGASSSMANRTPFKGPGPAGGSASLAAGAKRPLPSERSSAQGARPPLSDVSNVGLQPGGATAGLQSTSPTLNSDESAKRPRTDT